MKSITSKDNPKLRRVRALLRSKKTRATDSCFVMEGVRALNALAAGSALPQYKLQEVLVSDKASTEISADYCIPHDVMEQLSDCRTSQGVLAVVEYTPEPLAIDPEHGNWLLVDNLGDPGNLGTLIRSAVAFGFNGVFLHGETVELFNPKTVRATMGALPFCRCWKTDDELFPLLDELGFDLISTVIHGGENLHETAFGPKNVLVIGSEAHGVSDVIQQLATRKLSIPISGQVESLNAAVAGSICMCAMHGSKN